MNESKYERSFNSTPGMFGHVCNIRYVVFEQYHGPQSFHFRNNSNKVQNLKFLYVCL